MATLRQTKALEKRSLEAAGLALCDEHYPSDPDLRLALRRVMAILTAVEIRSGPARSPLPIRRKQRALAAAVRRLCKLDHGPAMLAKFITKLLGPRFWPYVPAGMELDPQQHFGADKCRQFIRDHLGLAKGEVNKEARALMHVLRAIIFRAELRQPFLRLAHNAHSQTSQKRDGWEGLRYTLVRVFNRIAKPPSNQRKVTDAMILYWPEVREMLSQHQAASLASTLKNKLKLVPSPKDIGAPEGKSTVEVQIRRARKQLKEDYGLDSNS